MVRFRLSVLAQADLDDIWNYIAEDNVNAADQFLDVLFDKFLLLVKFPELGITCENFSAGLRRLPVDRYMIFYRLKDEHIEIVRVLHGARDIQSIFEKII